MEHRAEPRYYFVPDEEQVYRIAILEALDDDSSLLKIVPCDAATGRAIPQAAHEVAAIALALAPAPAIE